MTFKNRIISCLFYLGSTLFSPSRLSREAGDSVVNRHFKKALIVSLILNFCIFLSGFIWFIVVSAFAVFSPRSIEAFFISGRFFVVYISSIILLFGISIWLCHVFASLIGKEIKLKPLAAFEKKGILYIAYFSQIFSLVLILIVMSISIHSYRLSLKVAKPARVYMLYDDMGFVPKWIFTLGFYRVQLAAQKRWGAGCVAIEPITHGRLKEALDNASLLFISVHGEWSYGEYAGQFHFFDEKREKMYLYGPDQIKRLGVGKNMRFVYLAHCHGGLLAEEWADAFHPAEIKSFDHISTYPEHIYWLWIVLPEVTKSKL